jgi:hypothetical protein
MTEVRKRTNDSGDAQQRDRDLAGLIGKERAEKITNLFAAVYPIFHILAGVLNQIWPYVSLLWTQALRLWQKLEPYHPLDLSSAAGGLFLAFFGGRYLLLLAAVEAARQVRSGSIC